MGIVASKRTVTEYGSSHMSCEYAVDIAIYPKEYCEFFLVDVILISSIPNVLGRWKIHIVRHNIREMSVLKTSLNVNKNKKSTNET